jgi:hypothetical protein
MLTLALVLLLAGAAAADTPDANRPDATGMLLQKHTLHVVHTLNAVHAVRCRSVLLYTTPALDS